MIQKQIHALCLLVVSLFSSVLNGQGTDESRNALFERTEEALGQLAVDDISNSLAVSMGFQKPEQVISDIYIVYIKGLSRFSEFARIPKVIRTAPKLSATYSNYPLKDYLWREAAVQSKSSLKALKDDALAAIASPDLRDDVIVTVAEMYWLEGNKKKYLHWLNKISRKDRLNRLNNPLNLFELLVKDGQFEAALAKLKKLPSSKRSGAIFKVVSKAGGTSDVERFLTYSKHVDSPNLVFEVMNVAIRNQLNLTPAQALGVYKTVEKTLAEPLEISQESYRFETVLKFIAFYQIGIVGDEFSKACLRARQTGINSHSVIQIHATCGDMKTAFTLARNAVQREQDTTALYRLFTCFSERGDVENAERALEEAHSFELRNRLRFGGSAYSDIGYGNVVARQALQLIPRVKGKEEAKALIEEGLGILGDLWRTDNVDQKSAYKLMGKLIDESKKLAEKYHLEEFFKIELARCLTVAFAHKEEYTEIINLINDNESDLVKATAYAWAVMKLPEAEGTIVRFEQRVEYKDWQFEYESLKSKNSPSRITWMKGPTAREIFGAVSRLGKDDSGVSSGKVALVVYKSNGQRWPHCRILLTENYILGSKERLLETNKNGEIQFTCSQDLGDNLVIEVPVNSGPRAGRGEAHKQTQKIKFFIPKSRRILIKER